MLAIPGVEKFTLRFGKRQSSASVGAWAGKPSDLYPGGAALISNAAAPAQNTLGDTADSFKVIASKSNPITAIGIAPDSPIAELDLYFDGSAVPHRVSAASPYVGTIERDAHIQAVPVHTIPALYSYHDTIPTVDQYREQVHAWEMSSSSQFLLDGDQRVAPHPMARLNVYRAGAPVYGVSQRAGYHADIMWRTFAVAGTALLRAVAFVVTDGRRRVRVRAKAKTVGDGGQLATMTIYGVNGTKSADGINSLVVDGRIDLPTFDELLAATAIPDDTRLELISDYEGNPYFAFYVAIDSVVAGARGGLHISCWDD